MDSFGWFIAALHQILGHRQTAAFLGEDPVDSAQCILCQYDTGEATRADVINRIGRK